MLLADLDMSLDRHTGTMNLVIEYLHYPFLALDNAECV